MEAGSGELLRDETAPGPVEKLEEPTGSSMSSSNVDGAGVRSSMLTVQAEEALTLTMQAKKL